MEASDQRPEMGPSKRGGKLLDLATASAREVEAALVEWDDLAPQTLDALATHPLHGPRVRALQLAQAWLSNQGERGRAPGVADCPCPEELYDYGRGPGYAPLRAERRAEIDGHVLLCRSCRTLTQSLASRPPLPLESALEAHDPLRAAIEGHVPRSIPPGEPDLPSRVTTAARRRARRRRRALRLVPVLAAASLVALVLILPDRLDAGARTGLPVAPVLRGNEGGPLLFPRGPVLALTAPMGWTPLRAGTVPRFEIEPVAGASSYRIEIFRHDGTAFDAGERVGLLQRVEPWVADLELEPGHYTWRAWAAVGGLERELGARDFELRVDARLEERLLSLVDLAEPGRTEAALRLLHEAGHLTDARALARTLAASPEREAYLERVPGR